MKITLEERVKKALLRFGRRNRICLILVMVPLAVSMFFFHVIKSMRENGKRLAMMALMLSFFVVYSSFSFPLFITDGGDARERSLTGVDSDVELAPETELTPEDMELLSDEDVLLEYEIAVDENPHGMDGMDVYDASEILESLENLEPKVEDVSSGSAVASVDKAPVFDKSDWRLVLINKQHSIPDDYTFTLGTIAGQMQCDERIIEELRAMLQAAKDDGVKLTVCSPYRSPDRQVMLFERKIKRYMARGMSYMEAYQLASQAVTVPGNSEHEIGLALDIVCDTYKSLDAGFGDTEAGKWLAANSYRYGFILRYPEGKEYVTGIEYEPWHFRYVGVEAATVITEQGITLEEFWERLE